MVCCRGGKNIPVIIIYIGSLAEHDMKGRMSIVMRRERGLSIVRVAMTAGTLHPNPMMSGMNDLPCSPILCIRRSMMKAARAIYPESSIYEMMAYRMRICGKKTMTEPTPLNMPSMTMSFSGPSGIAAASADDRRLTSFSISSMGYSPTVNVMLNIMKMMKRKMGNPM